MSENLVGNLTPEHTDLSDAAPGLTLATRLRFNVSGNIVALRWRVPDTLPGAASIPWFVTRYNAADDGTAGSSVVSGSFTTSTMTAGAYNTASFANQHMNAGDEVLAEIFTTDRYTATSFLLASDVVSSGGSITAPIDAAGHPNGRFNQGSSPAWPTSSFHSSFYHVDVVFTPDSSHTITIGSPTETDTAFSIKASKIRTIGCPTETDTAFPVSHSVQQLVTIGPAREYEYAGHMGGRRPANVKANLAVQSTTIDLKPANVPVDLAILRVTVDLA